jgi:HAD superfamily hydrolase (TIGR01509 family)
MPFSERLAAVLPKTEAENLAQLHEEAYARLQPQVRVLPGMLDLFRVLVASRGALAIATSARPASAQPMLGLLRLGPEVPIITRDQVEHAKPNPDLFLAAAKELAVPASESVVVGDSVWDLLAARRASAIGVGLLSGGYGQDELERAGAYRVYQDPLICCGTWTRLGFVTGDDNPGGKRKRATPEFLSRKWKRCFCWTLSPSGYRSFWPTPLFAHDNPPVRIPAVTCQLGLTDSQQQARLQLGNLHPAACGG